MLSTSSGYSSIIIPPFLYLSFRPRNPRVFRFFGLNFTRIRATILEALWKCSIASVYKSFRIGWIWIWLEKFETITEFRRYFPKPFAYFSPRIFKKVHRETLHACPCTREDRAGNRRFKLSSRVSFPLTLAYQIYGPRRLSLIRFNSSSFRHRLVILNEFTPDTYPLRRAYDKSC